MNKIISKFKFFLIYGIPKIMHKSRILSTLYYLLLNKSFYRENRAVLAGKVKYINDIQKNRENYFLLVRNIHRIEKGLLMRPRRNVFGKDYIEETMVCFEGVINNSNLDFENPQLKWFNDVLENYFEAINSDPLLSKLKIDFEKIKVKVSNSKSSLKSIPYFRKEFTNISYEDFYKLTKIRRSVRWFSSKSVERSIIDKAILAAIQSPSACNRQPFEYRIIDDPELINKIVELPMGTKGYSHSIPVMIVAIGNLDAYFDERDRHLIYIDSSLANMTLMLALETLGLSSVPINWPDIENREKQMDNFFNLKPYQRTIMCMGVGYPDPEGMVAFSEKRSLDQIRRYNLN